MSTTALCLYHANCVDGFAAAYVVYHALAGQVELRPVHYQEPPPPLWLQHVEDYDLWIFALPQTRVVNAALCFYARDIETWDRILQSVKWPELIEIGDILLQSRTSSIQFFAKNYSLSTFGGHIVPTANVPPDFANDVGNILAQGWPFAVTYWNGVQYRYFSLRSAPDGMNVAEIAEGFGGGGHHHAAGFRLPLPTNVLV